MSCKVLLLIAIFALPVATEAAALTVSKAQWDNQRQLLLLAGRCNIGDIVTIKDSAGGVVLGRTTKRTSRSWSMKVKIAQTNSVPCRVTANVGKIVAAKVVAGAPALCTNEPATSPSSGSYRLLAFNDLGMHCYDRDFSVFSLLPPFNVIHAQVVRKGGKPTILDDSQVDVYYRAVPDTRGSINTTSIGKSNFWDNVNDLFGMSLPDNQGILGATMPGAGNKQQLFSEYDPRYDWFTAPGIPILAVDDNNRVADYPMMRITAVNKKTRARLATTDIVLPVSAEMHCSNCHANGGVAADNRTAQSNGVLSWSVEPGMELAYRENILILHDAKNGTNLMNTKPVLCASCHYSPALDLAGTGPQGAQVVNPMLSFALHGVHGRTVNGTLPDANHPAIIPEDGTNSCYSCHPGSTTQCLRGAMGSAGIVCQDCHGGLLAVAGAYKDRTPWIDEPKCQSCHTGDAVQNRGGKIRWTTVYNPADPAATPLLAENKRFAEQNNTLFRNSRGHGGLACESCHGSTHAIWPSAEANDNVAALEIQGHAGTITECVACHGSGLNLTTNGPHGMHNVNDSRWNNNHSGFYEGNPAGCQACHGKDLRGTVLSRAAENRRFTLEEGGTVSVKKGKVIGCNLCHELP
ncbi:MAG: cytochrome C [Proteobacteria bacterium]|nr:cytochrome C [Pseudomonadota bacterium]